MSHYPLPDATAPDGDWIKDAACIRHDEPDLWFPVGNTPMADAQTREAKAICYGCPSIEACWLWSVETRQPYGVWGGMAERERRALLRRHGARLKDLEDEVG